MTIEKCIQCGNQEIQFFDCGYSSFNVCGIKCKHCDRELQLMGTYTDEMLLEHWNSVNGDLTDSDRVEALRNQIKRLGKTPIV